MLRNPNHFSQISHALICSQFQKGHMENVWFFWEFSCIPRESVSFWKCRLEDLKSMCGCGLVVDLSSWI